MGRWLSTVLEVTITSREIWTLVVRCHFIESSRCILAQYQLFGCIQFTGVCKRFDGNWNRCWLNIHFARFGNKRCLVVRGRKTQKNRSTILSLKNRGKTCFTVENIRGKFEVNFNEAVLSLSWNCMLMLASDTKVKLNELSLKLYKNSTWQLEVA